MKKQLGLITCISNSLVKNKSEQNLVLASLSVVVT